MATKTTTQPANKIPPDCSRVKGWYCRANPDYCCRTLSLGRYSACPKAIFKAAWNRRARAKGMVIPFAGYTAREPKPRRAKQEITSETIRRGRKHDASSTTTMSRYSPLKTSSRRETGKNGWCPVRTKQEGKPTAHHWLCEEQHGGYADAHCVACGAKKKFANSFETNSDGFVEHC